MNVETAGPVRSTTTDPVELTFAVGAATPSTVTVPAPSRSPSVPSVASTPGVTVTMYGPLP